MATKTKTSHVANNKQSAFKFRWWMALILVGIVTVIGIAVLRFSHAGGTGPGTVYCNQGTCYQTPRVNAVRTQTMVRTAGPGVTYADRFQACPVTGSEYQLYKTWVCLKP